MYVYSYVVICYGNYLWFEDCLITVVVILLPNHSGGYCVMNIVKIT